MEIVGGRPLDLIGVGEEWVSGLFELKIRRIKNDI